MAIQQIEAVVHRLSTDEAFRVKYCQDPDGTLSPYLSQEEIRALKTGDGHSFEVMGYGMQWEECVRTFCGDPGS